MSISLGLDFGTTSISAVAVAENGRLVARSTRQHRADVAGLPTGHAEQSSEPLLKAACDALAELIKGLSEPPICLGMTGQMHGVLLADANCRPLSNLITWQDKRSLERSDTGQTWLDRFRALCDPAAVLRTGCTPSPGYLAVTLFTLQQQNQIPVATKHALILADWAAATLTGTSPVNDRTNAASTGVYDLERDDWSDLIEAVGLPRAFFPPVVESGRIIGGLTAEFAAATRLPAGLPVCGAIGDHQAAVLGSLPPGENAVQVNIGTGGQVSLPIGSFRRAPTSDTRFLPDDRFLLVGAGLAGGDAYAWVRRTFGNWLESAGVCRTDDELFDTVNRLADNIPPGCDGLRCEPYFRGTRREPERRGGFSGISTGNFTPGHVARSILEGIADALAGFVREHAAHEDGSRSFDHVIATGNAVRRNPLLAACLARAFDRPVYVPEHEEEAAYGAAILAGVRTGLWPDLKTIGGRFRLTCAASSDDRD
ncbi:MAG: FGGY family carbohydrate kinase [Planctomycetaceae bacterium]